MQETQIRNENGGIITDITEIEGILREYYEQLLYIKLHNLE